jgi:hypothetical protein
MTAITNTVSTLNSIGNREDLEDIIYRVVPEETPFVNNIGSAKCSAIYHEWQTESLAAASATNAALEGDDLGTTYDAGNLTTRLGNYNQIMRKSGLVSRTEDIVNKAGRDSELDRQKILKGRELKRDIEMRFIGNYASVAESGATTRKSAGALAWLTSNTSLGATGTNGGFSAGIVAAAGNGTQRTLTEALVKTVLASIFNSAGTIKGRQAYMGAAHKQQFSAFTGIADIRVEANGKSMASIVGAADVYVSDFGNLTLIPHAYGLTRDVLIADPEYYKVGTLDGMKTVAMAKTGDAEKFMATVEKALICTNEKAHGAVRDLT